LFRDLQEFAEFINRFHTVSSRDGGGPDFRADVLKRLRRMRLALAGVEPAPARELVTMQPPRPESVA
jgi:hypothetical protein